MSVPEVIRAVDDANMVYALLVGGPRHGLRLLVQPGLEHLRFLDEGVDVVYSRAPLLDTMFVPDGRPAAYVAPGVRRIQHRRSLSRAQIEGYRGMDLIALTKSDIMREAVRMALEGVMPISRGVWFDRKSHVTEARIIELHWLTDPAVQVPHSAWTEVAQRLAYEKANQRAVEAAHQRVLDQQQRMGL